MSEATEKRSYEKKEYFLMALDPVHVGAGSYRIGLVDNTIIREPHTNLPKIPGTSIAGVARAYAALYFQSNNYKDKEKRKAKTSIYPNCAGKGSDDGESHCGDPECPVCTAFGFSKGDKGSSFKGLVSFSDAHLLFFPVHSSLGPVWVTCPELLARIDENVGGKIADNEISAFDSEIFKSEGLNLGWRWFDKKGDGKFNINGILEKLPVDIKNVVQAKGVVISNEMFIQVVNDNLEVRTSVAIDPMTGAAESGALYSYEALPRTTILWGK